MASISAISAEAPGGADSITQDQLVLQRGLWVRPAKLMLIRRSASYGDTPISIGSCRRHQVINLKLQIIVIKMTELVDSLMDQLDELTQKSASGNKSWDDFNKFLTALELLSKNIITVDMKEIIKRKHICYYIAGAQIDKNTQLAADVLPKIEKLVQSDIFPRETDFFLLCDWLQQVTFLFELIRPEDDSSETIPVELLNQTLNILSVLVGFCMDRLKREIIHQTSVSWCDFDKVCCIAIHGGLGLDTNSKSVELIKQLASLIKEPQFVAIIGKEQVDIISEKLWSIVRGDFRDITIKCYSFNYKPNKTELATHRSLLVNMDSTIRILPRNDEALEFFSKNLTKISRPE